jgi:alpha-D-xyloside xylohydrolase
MRGYLKQLRGLTEEALLYIENTQEQVIQSNSFHDKALWLYSFVSIAEEGRNKDLLDKYQKSIQHCIEYLSATWDQPHANLWGELENEVHISNIGMAYGALSAAKRLTGKTIIQKDLTSMRDFVFNQGLSRGMLIRSKGLKQVSTDLLVTVMPFGLFSPEDLVMVEAVGEIERNLVTEEVVFRYRGNSQPSSLSAAWLSWYFIEKGDIAKAKHYLAIATTLLHVKPSHEVELSEILIEVVDYYIDRTLGSKEEIKIIHTPYGNDNPYELLKTERYPREPEVGEEVRVQAQIWPEPENARVFVRLTTPKKGITLSCRRMEEEGQAVWVTSLGSFEYKEDVHYSFELHYDHHIEESDVYSFSPLKIDYLPSIESIGFGSDTFWLQGRSEFSETPVYIGLSNSEQGLETNVHIGKCVENVIFHNKGLIQNHESLFSFEEKGDTLIVSSEHWGCEIQKLSFQMKIYDKQGHLLLMGYEQLFPMLQWWMTGNEQIQKIQWNFQSPLEERVFGFGERYNQLEQRGEELDCYVYNQYRDQGSRTYIPVPMYISSKGYAFWLDTPFYSEFDLGKNYQDLVRITAQVGFKDPSITFHLFLGEPKKVCQQFTQKTGKPVLPPVWAFGPWMSSNNWDRDSVVREQIEKTNQYQIPSTVIVLEQWSDESTYYIFNDAEYEVKPGGEHHTYDQFQFPEWGRWPDPKGLVDYIHQNDLKLVLWQIPIQKYLNQQHHLQKDEDERFMIEQGYSVKNPDGTPYRMPEGWFKESLLMDYSHEEGKEWWFKKRQYLLDIGVDGFKTDGGEFVFGRDLTFADGRTGAEMRNVYPNDYVEAYYRFATDYHGGDALTFSRAGYTGAQNFPAHWAGDERSTFDAFRHSLIAGLTSGMAGIPFWGWDLAGFNGDIPTAELFIRSAEMAAFCPIMQYHAESKGEFNQDRTPWNIAERTGDERAIEGYRYYANLRMNLLPYIYDQAQKSSKTGIPLMRAMFMEYPNDPRCHLMYDQYMFGDHLLVAPIIEEGATERMVYFPEGVWFDLWSGKKIIGPVQERVKASLMHIPVYVKAGAVLLSNCNKTYEWGSWVGNKIDQYTTPVLRLFLESEMEQSIQDHLGQQWKIKVSRQKHEWNIEVDTEQVNTVFLVPLMHLNSNDVIVINGIIHNVKELNDDQYLLMKL